MHPLFLKMFKPAVVEENTRLLNICVRDNDIKGVKHFIPISDPRSKNSHTLLLAAQLGHTQCVQLLIPVSNPKESDYQAFRAAIMGGHLECVKLLVPKNNERIIRGIQSAVTYDQANVIQFLLTRVPPHTDHSWALKHACKGQPNPEVVDLLYDKSDPEAVVLALESEMNAQEGLSLLRARMKIDDEKDILEKAVVNSDTPSKKRKM